MQRAESVLNRCSEIGSEIRMYDGKSPLDILHRSRYNKLATYHLTTDKGPEKSGNDDRKSKVNRYYYRRR